MKTQSIDFQIPSLRKPAGTLVTLARTESALHLLMLVLIGVFPAIVITILTVWAQGAGGGAFISAGFWATGFVFLALALEGDGPPTGWLAISGITLMALAWLSHSVAPEFGVIAGFLLAAWLTAPVIKSIWKTFLND
jgi:hypothetical protein